MQTASLQELAKRLQKSDGVESEEVRAYLYEQRNNQDLFFQKGEYAQSGCDEVMMTGGRQPLADHPAGDDVGRGR